MEDTMTNVLAAYEADGYTGAFQAMPGGRVRCIACRAEMAGAKLRLDALHRLEGTSDPADMVAVAALVCPACGQKGTAVLSYGTEATAEDATLLRALQDHRADSHWMPGQ